MNFFGATPPVSSIAARSYRKGSGFRTTIRYLGSADQIRGIETFLLGAGCTEYQADYQTTPCQLLHTVDSALDGRPPENQVESIWSMSRTREHVDIWKHPAIVPVVQSLLTTGSYPAIAQLRANFDEAIRTGELNSQLTTWFTTYPALGELFERYAVHDDSMLRDRYVLRNTRTWPRTVVYLPDYANDNKTTTSAKIQTRFAGDIPWTLPDGKTWFTVIGELQNLADGRLQQTLTWEDIDPDAWKYNAVA